MGSLATITFGSFPPLAALRRSERRRVPCRRRERPLNGNPLNGNLSGQAK